MMGELAASLSHEITQPIASARNNVRAAMAKRAGATVVEVPGSHAIYVSNPSAVAALIERAASGVK